MTKRIFVFPGQGSQILGMGRDFFDNFKESRLVFEEASDSCRLQLKKLCFDGPLDELTITSNLQPALFTTEAAIFSALKVHTEAAHHHITSSGPNTLFAGHSLGEYAALWAAGALTISQAAALTHLRGKAMQDAVPLGKGTMAAVLGADAIALESLCRQIAQDFNDVVEPANYNGPGQIVISGSTSGIARFQEIMKTTEGLTKAKFIPLTVSAPFHCSLMKPAQEIMGFEMKRIPWQALQSPVIANVTAQAYPSHIDIPALLTQQITGAVKWQQSMESLPSLGVEELIEVGPGTVLTGLFKRISKGWSNPIKCSNIGSIETMKGCFP